MKAFITLWGPPIVGLLLGTLTLIKDGLTSPTGINWLSIGTATLEGILGIIVKGLWTTGGLVANTTAAAGTLPPGVAPKDVMAPMAKP